jgi:Flp pilus assembly protein TadG
MKVYNYPILSNVAMNANSNSAPLELYHMYGFCIQVVITNIPNGTLKLQASADPFNNQGTVTNWTDISGSTISVTTAGTQMWNVFDAMYNWVRIVYTDSSGGTSTAIMNATFNAKGV